MLMLLYADDLVLLAPSRSDLTTALEELEPCMTWAAWAACCR